ncbi:MAG: murein L,D-transpeptidase catalytic domain family protein [Parafilimonas sp.]
MKYFLIASFFSFCLLNSMMPGKNSIADKKIPVADIKNFPSLIADDASPVVNYWVDSLYNTMQLQSLGLSRNVFFLACKGYEYFLSKNLIQKPDLLTICDYSQRSTKKRLYVINIKEGKLLYNTYVAHGRNSGTDYATSFSNSADSHKSSLGFLISADTYTGENGYSLRFKGMEKGFNDNVYSRAIVMHGSDYVSKERAISGAITGRSFGCPAVSLQDHKKIIDQIKGGSCFFAYYADGNYQKTSTILNAHFEWPVAKILQPSIPEQNNFAQPFALIKPAKNIAATL